MLRGNHPKIKRSDHMLEIHTVDGRNPAIWLYTYMCLIEKHVYIYKLILSFFVYIYIQYSFGTLFVFLSYSLRLYSTFVAFLDVHSVDQVTFAKLNLHASSQVPLSQRRCTKRGICHATQSKEWLIKIRRYLRNRTLSNTKKATQTQCPTIPQKTRFPCFWCSWFYFVCVCVCENMHMQLAAFGWCQGNQ